MRSYAGFACDRSGGLVSARFLLGRLCLKCFYNAVFGFLNVFYVLSVYFTTVALKTLLNVFYSALLELVLVLAVSGTGSVLPQPFPVRSRVIPGRLCFRLSAWL